MNNAHTNRPVKILRRSYEVDLKVVQKTNLKNKKFTKESV